MGFLQEVYDTLFQRILLWRRIVGGRRDPQIRGRTGLICGNEFERHRSEFRSGPMLGRQGDAAMAALQRYEGIDKSIEIGTASQVLAC